MKNLLTICIIAFIALSCNKEAVIDPVPDELSLVGWACGYMKKENGTGRVEHYGVIIKTTDGGKSWVYQTTDATFPNMTVSTVIALSDQECLAILVDDSSNQEINKPAFLYKTTDGGQTWVKRSTNVNFEGNKFGVISLDATDIWATSPGWVYNSKDGGKTWTKTEMDCFSNLLNAEHIATYDGTNIYICGGLMTDVEHNSDSKRAFYYSNDAGKTWELGDLSLGGYLIDVSAPSNSVLYCVGSDGFVAKVSDNLKRIEIFNGIMIERTDVNGVYAADENNVCVVADYGRILTTSDGGKNWEEAVNHSENYGSAIMRVSFLQDRLQGAAVGFGLVGVEEGLMLYTLDGGKNWYEAAGGVKANMLELSFVQTKRR